MSFPRNVLTLSCANRPGIVAKVSTALFEGGFNILDAQQFDDTETGNFFMRVVFDTVERRDRHRRHLRQRFAEIAAPFAMNWSMRAGNERKRVLILVSRFDHCLVDLLYRWRSGELPMDIVGIGANYPRETYAHIDFGDIPFHYLPVTKQTKLEQENAGLGARARLQGRRRGARPLHADPVRRPRRQAAGALHQHPPLVPARLQGRKALPSGPSSAA